MFLVSFILFFIRGLVFLDPDFGWHLQAGNQILLGEIPTYDQFSYTMPSFVFINHEWLFDTFVSIIYRLGGMGGLSILFAIFGILIIYFQTRVKSPIFTNLIIAVLTVTAIEPLFGISPRVISWLFFTLTTYVVLNINVWKKYLWALPLILLLWTNLHGSFVLGLGILIIIFVTRSFEEKRVKINEFLVLLFSFLATFINPYGKNLWKIVYSTINDPFQKLRIVEWQSTIKALIHLPFLTFFIFCLTFIILIKYRNKFKLEEIILNILFFIFAVLTFRYVNYWILITLPMIGRGILYFYNDHTKTKNGQEKLLISLKYVFYGTFFIALTQYLFTTHHILSAFNESGFYPKVAVNYLAQNLPNGQIFSDYNWGGYLIWKLPKKKTFINGLMPTWKRDVYPSNESGDAMKNYIEIINTGNYKEQFQKYNIDTVLLPRNDKRFVLIKDNLIKDGWKEVYTDKISLIYQKY